MKFMLLAAAPAALLAGLAHAQDPSAESPPELTIERISASPSLTGETPRAVKFSPDGELLTFLKGKEDDFRQLDLWAFDLETGEERLLVDSLALEPEKVELSEEEKARRERQRIYETGIVSYEWDAQGDAVLVPIGGDIYYAGLTGETPDIRRLTETEAFETDPKISPEGNFVSFIRDQDLHVLNLESGEERAVTTQGEGVISFGMAEFVAQEEMKRYTGYWWSPDERFIAFTRVDESPVDIVERFEIGGSGIEVSEQRYPAAGTDNVLIELYVQDRETGERVQIDLGEETDIYLARVNWLNDDTLIVQRQNRAQDRLDILAADPATGETELLFSETSDTWVNLHDDFTPIADGEQFLWTSERDGFRHIYLYEADGDLIRQVTSGDWQVDSLAGVDEETGTVYFTGRRDTPLERQLYSISYTGEDVEADRITETGGTWSISMDENATAFVGTYSDPDQPPQTALYDTSGERIRWIEKNAVEGDHPYAPYMPSHIEPEFGTLETEDGVELYYSILKPEHCTAEAPCPAMQMVYGGPHVQTVTHGWTGTSDQLYADRGYVVFRIDNRGSANRGTAFENPIHRAMAGVEVTDQITGLDYLKSLDYVDGDRVGVQGWSYGGYMALNLAVRAPEAYAAAVSGAPVTDWALYDTHYTERYMGTPQNNAEGYEESSVFPYLGQLETPLLMIHGMSDDNVVFANSTRVYAELQEAGIPFEMMTYPGQRHHVTGAGRDVHLDTTILNFLDRKLQPRDEMKEDGEAS